MAVLNITSKTTGPVVTKFHEDPPGIKGTKICLNGPGACHILNMATMPVHEKKKKNNKKHKKIFFSGINGLMALKHDV